MKYSPFLLIIGVFYSCVTTTSTFTKEWEREIGINHKGIMISISDDENKLFAAEREPVAESTSNNVTKIGSKRYKSTFINLENGHTIWNETNNKLGNISNNPQTIEIVWGKNTGLFISKTLTKFKLTAVNLISKKELWSIEENNPAKFSDQLHYINEANGVIVQSSDVIKLIDIDKGETLWSIKNPSGSFLDIENTQQYSMAILFGSNDKNIAKELAMAGESTLTFGKQTLDVGNIKNRLIKAIDEAPKATKIRKLNLVTGKIEWESEIISKDIETNLSRNIETYLELINDKIVLINDVVYVIDSQTGEVLWQSVSKEALLSEKRLAILKEFRLSNTNLASDRSITKPILSEDHIILIYSEIDEERNKFAGYTLRKYSIESGELIWKSGLIKYYPSKIQTHNDVIIVREYFFDSKTINFSTFNLSNGNLLYEFKEQIPKKTTVLTYEILTINDKLYLSKNSVNSFLDLYNLYTNDLIENKYKEPVQLTLYNLEGQLFSIQRDHFKKQNFLSVHNPDDFSILKTVYLPQGTYGRSLEIYDKHIILTDNKFCFVAIDKETFQLKGYLLAKKEGQVYKNGVDQLAENYTLILSENEDYLMEINAKKISKYKL
jgi:hypothetical protein